MSRSALVTGASKGIGLGIATRLATLGYGLTITARDSEKLEVVAEGLRSAGSPDVVVVAGDMANEDFAAELVAVHGDRFDSMRALILNAGVGTSGSVADYPMRRFDKTVAVNLRTPFALLQAALPLLRAAADNDLDAGAKVITLSSMAGVYAESGLAVYGATKAALISMVEAFNAEESGNGISATAIAPGYVDTDMSAWTQDRIPPDTMIKVDDIVELVDGLLRLSARAVVPKVVMTRAGTDGYRA
ncbi:SDR family NAD(P)-dependent oxidoreductase [Rhodococcus sp. OK302]|uniref:SDR family NAD(P)-dependent oxidoreductase n=1 Tax=Rhodococcus sp. OK302 TaxID=1882769 RepID=UPI000B93DEDF|nr:SDR family oxidoreductase [Rhodococcus sp. OK302]OYD66989.1 short-subunit dehydrogenase [Rhodococcus sp. OK302]